MSNKNLLKRIAEKEIQLKEKIAKGDIDVSHLAAGPPELDRESEKIMRGEPRDVFLARRRSGLDHQGDPENL